jgi:hypothetical protein
VIPVYIGYCAVFKDREKERPRWLRAGLSKLNSMRTPLRRSGARPVLQCVQPGPVDMSSPRDLRRRRTMTFDQGAGSQSGMPCGLSVPPSRGLP